MDYIKGKISHPLAQLEKRYVVIPIFITSIIFSFLLITSLSSLNAALVAPAINASAPPPAPPPLPIVPRLAYFISGSKGDLYRLWRTLYALYHPRNIYVLHLDLDSPAAERRNLAELAANHTLFAMVGNVHVIAKANMVTYRGATMVANTLHACAILLKKSKDWDWFINLSASDYPLVTQDDLLFTFSKLPKNLNFVEHTSLLGWKEDQRAKPLIIDPGLYKKRKSDVFWVPKNRELPDAFKLFTGSAWMALTREFVEFCIWGWDNLPRTLLMYYTNFLSSPEGYFHTVLCNSQQFNTTVVNHDLHYISWDNPPKQHPHILALNDTAKMIRSNAPFARKFRHNDPVLDRIDTELLRRPKDRVIPGGWCSSTNCSVVADEGRLNPGPGSVRLAQLMNKLVLFDSYKLEQCKVM